jgi:Ceramidase
MGRGASINPGSRAQSFQNVYQPAEKLTKVLKAYISSDNDAFWGPVTSSVDWCEVNYSVTPYAAEFFNTASSLAMAIVGMMGICLHPWAERRFHLAFLSTVAVGLGSVAFHGTLQKFTQALDEVPMLYSALAFAYIGICQTYNPKPSTRNMVRIFNSSWALHCARTQY